MPHAVGDVEIDCHKMDCRWNDNAKCAAGRILVNEGPTCVTYEPMPAPMMGGPAMGPTGGAPVGGPAPDPALLALLAGGGGVPM